MGPVTDVPTIANSVAAAPAADSGDLIHPRGRCFDRQPARAWAESRLARAGARAPYLQVARGWGAAGRRGIGASGSMRWCKAGGAAAMRRGAGAELTSVRARRGCARRARLRPTGRRRWGAESIRMSTALFACGRGQRRRWQEAGTRQFVQQRRQQRNVASCQSVRRKRVRPQEPHRPLQGFACSHRGIATGRANG